MNEKELRKELQELNEKLSELETRETEIQDEIDNFEIDPYDFEDQYCEMLDEETVTVAGMEYQTSRVLREVDPTAYRVGLVDWADSLDVSQAEEYRDLEESLEMVQEEIEEVQERIDEVEEELEELEE